MSFQNHLRKPLFHSLFLPPFFKIFFHKQPKLIVAGHTHTQKSGRNIFFRISGNKKGWAEKPLVFSIHPFLIWFFTDKTKKVPHSHFRHTVTLHYKHKQLMPGKAPAFPLHVRHFSKSQNMIPRRGTHKKELYQYSSTGYRCCQFVLYYIWYAITV